MNGVFEILNIYTPKNDSKALAWLGNIFVLANGIINRFNYSESF